MGRHKCHVVRFHDTWCPGLLLWIHISPIRAVSPLLQIHVPDPKLASTFYFMCSVCLRRTGCVILNMGIRLSKYGNAGRAFAKCLSVQPIIPITPFLVLSLVCISDESRGERTGELLLSAKCHDKLIFSLKSQTMDKT